MENEFSALALKTIDEGELHDNTTAEFHQRVALMAKAVAEATREHITELAHVRCMSLADFGTNTEYKMSQKCLADIAQRATNQLKKREPND